MPNLIRNIKKPSTKDTLPIESDQEWLALAALSKDAEEVHINKAREGLCEIHGSIAADGYRLHSVDGEVCGCGNDHTHKSVEGILVLGAKAKPAFAVQKQFLIDALAGMNDFIYVYVIDKKSPVFISDGGNRLAAIMPLSVEFRPLVAEKLEPLPFR